MHRGFFVSVCRLAGESRRALRAFGPDVERFIQGTISGDVSQATARAVSAAMLTVKGKVVNDLVVVGDDEALWLWIPANAMDAAQTRLDRHVIMDAASLARRADVSAIDAVLWPVWTRACLKGSHTAKKDAISHLRQREFCTLLEGGARRGCRFLCLGARRGCFAASGRDHGTAIGCGVPAEQLAVVYAAEAFKAGRSFTYSAFKRAVCVVACRRRPEARPRDVLKAVSHHLAAGADDDRGDRSHALRLAAAYVATPRAAVESEERGAAPAQQGALGRLVAGLARKHLAGVGRLLRLLDPVRRQDAPPPEARVLVETELGLHLEVCRGSAPGDLTVGRALPYAVVEGAGGHLGGVLVGDGGIVRVPPRVLQAQEALPVGGEVGCGLLFLGVICAIRYLSSRTLIWAHVLFFYQKSLPLTKP